MTTARTLADVAIERDRQDHKWGLPHDTANGTGPDIVAPGLPFTYQELRDMTQEKVDQAKDEGTSKLSLVLLEEVFEALAESDDPALRTELIQVAAVAVKWVEIIDARTAEHGAGAVAKSTEWGVQYGSDVEPAGSEHHADILAERLFPDDVAGTVVSRQVLTVQSPWAARS